MFRLGIVSKDCILAQSRRHNPRTLVAFTLLTEFNGELTDRDEESLVAIYECIDAGPVTKMRTFRHRYQAVDEAIEAEIEECPPTGRPIQIRDLAVSNGITSLELFERLERRWDVTMRATDYFDSLQVVSVNGWRVVFDAEGVPLQFIGKRWVIPARGNIPRRYPINRMIRKYLIASVLPKASSALTAARHIPLFHPDCLTKSRNDRRFNLGRENAFEPENSPCDVMRTMNLLLGQKRLAKIAGQVIDGGLLVLGTTPDGLKQIGATIFRRCGRNFVAIRDIGQPYVEKATVLGLNLPY